MIFKNPLKIFIYASIVQNIDNIKKGEIKLKNFLFIKSNDNKKMNEGKEDDVKSCLI
jgi:hypothetical protein